MSDFQRTQFIKEFLDHFGKYVQWNKDGEDEVIDIGCGTGYVTCEVLYPLLPSNIKNLVGVDVDKTLVDTATKKYCNNPKIQFKLLDIRTEIPVEFQEKYHHVFSFFCLHWIKNQELAMKNIYSLLKPGGDTRLLFVGSCDQIIKCHTEMAKDPRWQKYMLDLDNILPSYLYEKNPEECVRKYMENAGFDVKICINLYSEQNFENDQLLKDFLASINPFAKRMPEDEREEYMKMHVEMVQKLDPKKTINGPKMLYVNMLSVYACKPL